MRFLSLREYQTSAAVELDEEERDLIQRLVPSLTVSPTVGTSGLYDLTPSSWIGVAEFPTFAVEIRPKIPIDRVLFLISYALDPRAWREEPFRFATDVSLVEAMIPPFVSAVAQALRRGVLQGYRIEEEALAAVRGRIRFDEQIRRWYGRLPPIELRFDEFTEDIEQNRLLKAALDRLRRLRIRSSSARASLRGFDQALERVRLVEYDPRQLPEIQFTRLNEHYRRAVNLSRLILRGTSLEFTHGQERSSAMFVDMNRVFEDFVVVALREQLHLSEREFTQGSRRRVLYLDQGRRIRLKPDLSWWHEQECVFVGDVKYKRVTVADIPHADLYQLLAYTIASRLPGGLLVYSADEAEPVEHEIPFAGKRLKVAALDVSDQPDQILARIANLADGVRQLAREGLHTQSIRQAA